MLNRINRLLEARRRARWQAACLLALCAITPAFGHLISSGGGTSQGGGFAVSGSIGQPVVDTSFHGALVVRAGFWNLVMQARTGGTSESFEAWMNALPPEAKPPEGLRGPLDEPAGDGINNLLKYALGLLPMDLSRDGYPAFANVPDPQNPGNFLLAIEFTRSRTANVLTWLEGSADLAGWAAIPFTEELLEELADGRERVRFVSTMSLAPEQRYFITLVVELPSIAGD